MMLMSNAKAAQILADYGVTACTDITGFGLLGHLLETVEASKVREGIYFSMSGSTLHHVDPADLLSEEHKLQISSWSEEVICQPQHTSFPCLRMN